MKIDNIILIGYMASGKSTIGVALAKKMKMKHIDLDNVIENIEGNSVEKIFETKGEVYFRRIENEVLKNILNTKKNIVLSTGGGTPCYHNNHLLLKKPNIFSIYLKAKIETLTGRLKNDKLSRPMVKNIEEDGLEEFLAKHLFERSFFYNQADVIVSVDNKEINDIVFEIEENLKNLD